MEVDDDEEDSNRSHQVHQVGQVLSVEGFTETPDLVSACSQQVEQSDDGTFELGTFSGVNCGWREGFPDNSLTDVSGDEQGNSENGES